MISLAKKGISGIKTITATTASGTKTFSMDLIWNDDFDGIANTVKQQYITER